MASTAKRNPATKASAATISKADIDAIIGGYHGAPFSVLGPHLVPVRGEERVVIRHLSAPG